MAYVSKEKKAKIAAALKKVVPKGWKYSLAVRNHSSIVFTLYEAPADLCGEYFRVHNAGCEWRGDAYAMFKEVPSYFDANNYHLDYCLDEHLPVFEKINEALNVDNYDRSDSMVDYFDVGHYVDIHVGNYKRPFVCSLNQRMAA